MSQEGIPCVLCGRPGHDKTYYLNSEVDLAPGIYLSAVEVRLCGSHAGNYMSKGNKELESKIQALLEPLRARPEGKR